MARARNIKPGFFKNEDLAECSVWARLLFPGLWMMADREGRLEDRPKRMKGEIFPYDNVEIEPLLQELERHNFLIRYANDEGNFIQIAKFKEHQNPHYSEKASVIKPPDSENLPVIKDNDNQEQSESQEGLKGGQNVLIPESLLLNPDSLIPESLKEWVVNEGHDPTYAQAHWAFFVDYLQSKKKQYKNPVSAFRNCIRSDWGGIREKWSRTAVIHGAGTFGKTSQGIALLEQMKG